METAEYTKMDAVEAKHWWFRAKRDFLASALADVPTGARVLDIGCGTGAIMQFLKDKGFQPEGIDMSPAALEFCQAKQLTVWLGEADKLPVADNSFDVVVALDVLEHVHEPLVALREIRRVLKPGGRLVATVPAHQFLFSYHDVALHHVKRYSRVEFAAEVGSVLSIRRLTWIHAAILLPAIIVRKIINRKPPLESDVKPTPPLVNAVMRVWYAIEVGIFRLFGRLPFGLSLLVVAEK